METNNNNQNLNQASQQLVRTVTISRTNSNETLIDEMEVIPAVDNVIENVAGIARIVSNYTDTDTQDLQRTFAFDPRIHTYENYLALFIGEAGQGYNSANH